MQKSCRNLQKPVKIIKETLIFFKLLLSVFVNSGPHVTLVKPTMERLHFKMPQQFFGHSGRYKCCKTLSRRVRNGHKIWVQIDFSRGHTQGPSRNLVARDKDFEGGPWTEV